jgi:hypothetical protein
MKGVMGLFTAIALGVVGALCNFLYLAQKARDLEKIDFIGIADEVQINPGDKFKESDLIPISIPRPSVGNLEKAALLFRDKSTVVGMSATRSYIPGEVVLRQDLRTPPSQDVKKLLGPNEELMWVPVDTRTFVPSHVSGGDLVLFVVPRFPVAALPPPAEGEVTPRPVVESSSAEVLGPFRVLALGNRLGSAEVLRASGVNAVQENVMAIAVEADRNGVPVGIGAKLLEFLRQTNFQQVQVLLPKGKEK